MINELAEQFCAIDLAYDAKSVESPKDRVEPLQWIQGGFVAPSLRSAQKQFQEAVAMAVETANCRRALDRALGCFQRRQNESREIGHY